MYSIQSNLYGELASKHNYDDAITYANKYKPNSAEVIIIVHHGKILKHFNIEFKNS